MSRPLWAMKLSRDDCIREFKQTLRDVNFQDAKVDSSRSDNEEFVENHTVVKDFWFEVSVPLKTGVEAMPDNLVLAQKRLDSLRKNAMEGEYLHVSHEIIL